MNNNIVKTKKAKVGRPNKFDAEKQTAAIADMLLASRPRKEIIEFCVQTYGLHPTSVTNLVTRAYKYIAETYSVVDREGLVMTHIEKYHEVYRLAIALGDSRGAIAALNSIEKILKLVMPETAIQNNNISLDVSKLSVSELKELLGKNN